MTKSIKLSITGKGMIYVCLYVIASSIYISIFVKLLVFLNMIILSFFAIIASILSDRKTLYQYISVLIFSGAKKKTILFCTRTYILIRVIPIFLAYTTLFIYFNFYLITIITGLTYVFFVLYLSYPIYKAIKK
jgi:hypothetical protein